MRQYFTLEYGRKLDDFAVGEIYEHPWEVTVDSGMMALFAASFLDATPVFASRSVARHLGFRDRPASPWLLLNLALSFSVHDVSEQAIAHLSYLDVRFPEPAYAGDTLTASSEVLDVKRSKSAQRGVVHVRTRLQTQDGSVACVFERKALIRAGRLDTRPKTAESLRAPSDIPYPKQPSVLREPTTGSPISTGFFGYFEDFEPGQVFVHAHGRTVGESEHMQLTTLVRNSHPLHFDSVYCEKESFTKRRIVYGGLVLSWVLSLASRDTTGHGLWPVGLDEGAHPNPTHGGDTLFALSRVLSTQAMGPHAGVVQFRVIGVKNEHPVTLLEKGADLFTPEIQKTEGHRVEQKVVEITRAVLVEKRQACNGSHTIA
ncbi:MAG TPA: MaoC family dehydratase [Polyangiaceae bacterium]|jgi:2-methylfumaryl-CoA hydratase|nr:MAG: bifunctional aldehyde dehydrogenase/enoyl-CoA hydratase [Deltaproteobacteria bacterium ADurb.Bin207]HNS96154.1 MaoC family dehydratase [Polyangiaceae bacterium]HNZ22240.1 MaoC family dehydratase [Polyangiaceae bacterium]HOD22244.1 MaoC family dehydratase [Polyangiaceae bacterium]HOE47064.1 MaoC family dehydratase [Polyangiaceae bacterium]